MFQEIQPHRFNNCFRIEPAGPGDILLCYDNQKILLEAGETENDWRLPRAERFPQERRGEAVYLFSVDDTRYFTFWQPHGIREIEGLVWQSVQVLRQAEDPLVLFAGMEGWHLYRWFRINRFCGHCGAETRLKADERATVCPTCGNVVYPRISPAIIVGVRHGEKLLIARNAANKTGRFGLVAGFVEFGESLEDTVRREVREEVGLKVKNVRYYGSQPWPFSESLMLGFFAEVDGDPTPHPDGAEIAEAKWVTKEELPQPLSNISIAQALMTAWQREVSQGEDRQQNI